MNFNSLTYALFLAIVVATYWRLSRRNQNLLLLVASYVFYGWWDHRFLALIWLSTILDYTVGRRLGSSSSLQRRRWLLAASVIGNLGMLGTFKYAGFFAESAAEAFARLGVSLDAPTLEIVLPVGISFYTFQTLSYTIDVYRGELAPTPSLLDFATYVAFFPQLVAGPIERATRLLPQFAVDRTRPDAQRTARALELITIGLFQKIVIADGVAFFVDQTFAQVDDAGWIQLAGAALAFSLQIYGDFAGYSSIARGSARLLGIELIRNFEQPYLSASVTEFWRRWHISLSTWLRDYLYIPLGGNRGTRRRTLANLMATMLLGGLWHGAAWTFVIWGALHGLYLATERVLGLRPEGQPTYSPGRWPAIVATFTLVSLTWIPFRADSLNEATRFLQRLLSGAPDTSAISGIEIVVGAAVVALVLDVLMVRTGTHTPLMSLRPATAGATFGTMLVMMIVFTGQPTVPFIYFQF